MLVFRIFHGNGAVIVTENAGQRITEDLKRTGNTKEMLTDFKCDLDCCCNVYFSNGWSLFCFVEYNSIHCA